MHSESAIAPERKIPPILLLGFYTNIVTPRRLHSLVLGLNLPYPISRTKFLDHILISALFSDVNKYYIINNMINNLANLRRNIVIDLRHQTSCAMFLGQMPEKKRPAGANWIFMQSSESSFIFGTVVNFHFALLPKLACCSFNRFVNNF